MARKKWAGRQRASGQRWLSGKLQTLVELSLLFAAVFLAWATLNLTAEMQKLAEVKNDLGATEHALQLDQSIMETGGNLALANDLVGSLEQHKAVFESIKATLPGFLSQPNEDASFLDRFQTSTVEQAISKHDFAVSTSLREKLPVYLSMLDMENKYLDAIRDEPNKAYREQDIDAAVHNAVYITENAGAVAENQTLGIDELIREAKDYANRTNDCYLQLNEHAKNPSFGNATCAN